MKDIVPLIDTIMLLWVAVTFFAAGSTTDNDEATSRASLWVAVSLVLAVASAVAGLSS